MPETKEYIERGPVERMIEAVERMLENAQIVSDGEYSGYCTEDISLDEIPAADIVEVVRCEKCVHFRRIKSGEHTIEGCTREGWWYRNPDDYCSYGERKEINNDT